MDDNVKHAYFAMEEIKLFCGKKEILCIY